MDSSTSETFDQTLSKIVIFSKYCFLKVTTNKKAPKMVGNRNLVILILLLPFDIAVGNIGIVMFLLFAKIDRRAEPVFHFLKLLTDISRQIFNIVIKISWLWAKMTNITSSIREIA